MHGQKPFELRVRTRNQCLGFSTVDVIVLLLILSDIALDVVGYTETKNIQVSNNHSCISKISMCNDGHLCLPYGSVQLALSLVVYGKALAPRGPRFLASRKFLDDPDVHYVLVVPWGAHLSLPWSLYGTWRLSQFSMSNQMVSSSMNVLWTPQRRTLYAAARATLGEWRLHCWRRFVGARYRSLLCDCFCATTK